MARLRDVPKVLRAVGVIGFARRVWNQQSDDNLFTWASALAYSWLFAFFPFLIFLLSLVPYLPAGSKTTARLELQNLVYQLPRPAADTVWTNIADNLDNLLHEPRGWLLYVGLGVTVWAASGGMAATMSGLNRCYELETSRPWYVQRPLAVGLTLIVAVLILAVVILLPVGTLVKAWVVRGKWAAEGSALLVIFDVLRWAAAVAFMITVLAVVYHFGPAVKHRFHWLTPGAAFCLVVWVVLGLVFRVYVEKFGKYNQTYGAVGGVAVLLLVFYVDALMLLIGAEINSEIDFEVLKVRRGTRNFLPAEDEEEADARGETKLAAPDAAAPDITSPDVTAPVVDAPANRPAPVAALMAVEGSARAGEAGAAPSAGGA